MKRPIFYTVLPSLSRQSSALVLTTDRPNSVDLLSKGSMGCQLVTVIHLASCTDCAGVVPALSTATRVEHILTVADQEMYLLAQLNNQGLSHVALHIFPDILYCLLLGSPMLVGCLKLLSFLPDHGAQQPRRRRPSNVYQRFGHRCSYYH